MSEDKRERRKVKARLFTIISKMEEVKSLADSTGNDDLISCSFRNFLQELECQHYTGV